MPDLLLELFSEEIPARMQAQAARDLERMARERLAEADIALPAALTFVAVDFERETLAEGLSAAGFDVTQQTFFTWLGVVPYLTDDAIFATLGFIAGLSGGAHVVFDYVNPTASVTEPARRAAHEALVARVAAAGESIRNHFDSAALHVRLKALGFRDVEDFGWAEIAARSSSPAAPLHPAAARMCCAHQLVGRISVSVIRRSPMTTWCAHCKPAPRVDGRIAVQGPGDLRSDLGRVQSHVQKYFHFTPDPNHPHITAVPSHLRGVSRSSRT